jgi:hypothetical protein
MKKLLDWMNWPKRAAWVQHCQPHDTPAPHCDDKL